MKNTTELYENKYTKSQQFSFGKNWQDFIKKSFTPERIANAQLSLVDFLGKSNLIKGKTFVDIGCGSGLFSLTAYNEGARQIVSVDVDSVSVSCTNELKKMAGSPSNWTVIHGSALDADFIRSLGQFDILYSWGALHHTGDMYRALTNMTYLLSENSLFYLAIYNRGRIPWSGTSEFWLSVKRVYSKSGKPVKHGIFILYVIYFFINSLLIFRNPFKTIKKGNRRGMDWYHNIIDWLGGYPYEFASPDEIVNFFAKRNIYCEKITNGFGLGCVDYLFRYIPR
jgi:2-polyprenyl-6-hydroxyphenyl methylase/3-demethylubiquinone-9 3-methyltransferase